MKDSGAKREKPLALVVDDELSLRISMAAAMIKAGFDVVEADNGCRAVNLFPSLRPDIVLLDVVMPEMDGYETCAAIRKLSGGRYAQILMVTGLDDTDSIERAFEAGANDFIAKPLNWTMLGHRGKYMLRAGTAFQELDRSKQRLARTQELAKLGNWEMDIARESLFVSLEARRLFGFDEESRVTLDDFFLPVSSSERDLVKEKIFSAISSCSPFSINYSVILPDGKQRYILNRGEFLLNKEGTVERLLGAVQDVTQLKLAEEEIRLLAFYDGLTGLANRTLFMDRLKREISLARRNNENFALLFLDLDQFKRVNDSFGHHVGDLLLKKVSEILQKCIRSGDVASRLISEETESLVARFGGDEFTFLLSNINEPENAAIVARRILQEVPATYDLNGHEISVTASIGISVYPTDSVVGEALLKYADTAMYHAKESGRNNYQFFRKALNEAVKERFSLENDMKDAARRGEFQLHYQPQIELSTGRIVGAEALIRWNHPKKGMIPPNKFIPIAEESGLIIKINKYVIREACKQNSQWKREGLGPIKVAVNLSGHQFANQNIVQVIQDALEDSGLNGKDFEVEITENILMQETQKTIRILREIKELDVKVALDDFGTGFSSLNYLVTFPVDIIKIDRSFVMDCIDNKKNRVIIRAINAMGHSLGMTIIAEGIETGQQLELIKKYGADEGQGNYFSRPLPSDIFAARLARGRV